MIIVRIVIRITKTNNHNLLGSISFHFSPTQILHLLIYVFTIVILFGIDNQNSLIFINTSKLQVLVIVLMLADMRKVDVLFTGLRNTGVPAELVTAKLYKNQQGRVVVDSGKRKVGQGAYSNETYSLQGLKPKQVSRHSLAYMFFLYIDLHMLIGM